MKALVLAAGYATRLYPLTKDFPKPLLPVGSRPMLDYLMDRLAPLGLTETLVVTNHRFAPNFESWAGTRGDPSVAVLDDGTNSESDRLGAIGDMSFAVRERRVTEPLLVIAGDNLFDFPLDPFVEHFRKTGDPVVGLYEFPKWNLLSKYGIVTLDENGVIIEFQEKPKEPRSHLVAMCLYLFPAESLSGLETYLSGPDPRDAPGNYIRWLMTRRPVRGHRFQGTWLDIGDMESLDEARAIFGSA
ncbi:nucleotidyltransferase family protein [bacterium]|nr:nucleotidyltransferase family protein [bacterium]